jgi:hypothetical protein
MGQEWSSHGGSRFDRMDRYIDRHGRMNVANPTFEEMVLSGTALGVPLNNWGNPT